MSRIKIGFGLLAACVVTIAPFSRADAQQQMPNIILIVSDDFGYGDASSYGGPGRDMPTPNLERLATEGMTFLFVLCAAKLHAGPRCHSGRAHSQPKRHDDRGLPGRGGLPAAEWTLGSVMKTAVAELPQWLHRYNWHRPHGSIGARPPISRSACPRTTC